MDDDFHTDRSVSRGLIRQTLRNSADIIRNLKESPRHDIDERDESRWPLESRVLKRAVDLTRNRAYFNTKGFDGLVRDIESLQKNGFGRITQTRLNIHPRLPYRSRCEISARNELIIDDRQIGASSFYIGLTKRRLIFINRLESMMMWTHALERHIQRGTDIELKEKRVIDTIGDCLKMKGFGLFLMGLTDRRNESAFVIPYKDGLWLCRNDVAPARTPVIVVEIGRSSQKVAASARDIFHPWLHGHGHDHRAMIGIRTYVGPGNLTHAQRHLCEVLEEVRLQHEGDFDLLGRLDDIFHLGQDPELMDLLDEAAPRLDAAAGRICEAMHRFPYMARAFGGIFDPSAVERPSERIRAGRDLAEKQAARGTFLDHGAALEIAPILKQIGKEVASQGLADRIRVNAPPVITPPASSADPVLAYVIGGAQRNGAAPDWLSTNRASRPSRGISARILRKSPTSVFSQFSTTAAQASRSGSESSIEPVF